MTTSKCEQRILACTSLRVPDKVDILITGAGLEILSPRNRVQPSSPALTVGKGLFGTDYTLLHIRRAAAVAWV